MQSSNSNPYEAAIEVRKQAIQRMKKDPPQDWAPEYIAENVRLIESQIRNLEATPCNP